MSRIGIFVHLHPQLFICEIPMCSLSADPEYSVDPSPQADTIHKSVIRKEELVVITVAVLCRMFGPFCLPLAVSVKARSGSFVQDVRSFLSPTSCQCQSTKWQFCAGCSVLTVSH